MGVGCSWVSGALGGCNPLPGGNMGCVQPRTGDDRVSPRYHTLLMLLDTDIIVCKLITVAEGLGSGRLPRERHVITNRSVYRKNQYIDVICF